MSVLYHQCCLHSLSTSTHRPAFSAASGKRMPLELPSDFSMCALISSLCSCYFCRGLLSSLNSWVSLRTSNHHHCLLQTIPRIPHILHGVEPLCCALCCANKSPLYFLVMGHVPFESLWFFSVLNYLFVCFWDRICEVLVVLELPT